MNQSFNILNNFPYTINEIFTQICQYKIFEVKLKRKILASNKNILTSVALINSAWFEKWKKISCYEAIKDELNMCQSIGVNHKTLIGTYLEMKENLNINENLDKNINNTSIISGFDDFRKRYKVNPYANFELISRDLWNCFVPPNTPNVNNGTLVELELEYLTKKSLIIHLDQTSCYIIFWNINEQKINKLILIFSSVEEKNKALDNLKSLGINNFYSCYLSDLEDYKNVDNVLSFYCINKSENKKISIKNDEGNQNISLKNSFNNYYNDSDLPPVGLENIFMTCYMNSALQSLVHIPKLSKYFLGVKSQLDYSQPLSRAYLEVVENLLRKTNESRNIFYYRPDTFYNIASQNPLFQCAGDSIDMLNYFLQTIHEEFNLKSKGNSLLKYMINNANTPKFQALNNVIMNFSNHNQSIIVNLFYFLEKSKLKCHNCKGTAYSFQCLFYIIFPLEEIRKAKSLQYGMNLDCVDLIDGFNYYKRDSIMAGENEISCNFCGLRSSATQCNSLYSLPDILIINLNRGRGNIYNVKIQIPENIDLSNQVESNIDNNHNYRLICLITHFGPNGTSGHFIAFCFVQGKNKWYKFNDSIVSESDFKEASNSGDIYILFYQRQ